jgi:hypothetical protein
MPPLNTISSRRNVMATTRAMTIHLRGFFGDAGASGCIGNMDWYAAAQEALVSLVVGALGRWPR